MLRITTHSVAPSITHPRTACGALAASLLVFAAAGCKDSGIPPGRTAAARSAPAVVEPETTATPAQGGSVAPPVVSYATAESTFHARRYAEAMEMFDGYTKSHPQNPWGFYMLGLSAWKAGSLERAQRAFEDALALDPTHVKSLVNLGRVLLEADRPREARSRIEQAIALDSGSSDAYRVLGRIEAGLGNVDEALAAYRTALALDPEDLWSMNNMGLLLIQRGRFDEALGPLARAVQLSEGNAVFENNLGIALERTGHYTAAAEAYRAALAADSGYEKARVSLARVEGRADAPGVDAVSVAQLGDAFAARVASWHVARAATVVGDTRPKPDSAADSTKLPDHEP
jgi:tetratricopeptide (TPR) repeat protein